MCIRDRYKIGIILYCRRVSNTQGTKKLDKIIVEMTKYEVEMEGELTECERRWSNKKMHCFYRKWYGCYLYPQEEQLWTDCHNANADDITLLARSLQMIGAFKYQNPAYHRNLLSTTGKHSTHTLFTHWPTPGTNLFNYTILGKC